MIAESLDPADVLRWAEPLLAAAPVESTSVSSLLVSAAPGGPAGHRWFVAVDADRPVGVLVVEPSGARRAQLFCDAPTDDEAASTALAESALSAGVQPATVGGPVASTAAFAAAWQVARGVGVTARTHIQLQTFDERDARPLALQDAAVRLATEEDVGWLCDWFIGFDRETFDQGFDPEPAVRSKLGVLWLLEVDGVPVSMAAASPSAFGVRRLHLVYTPPERRGAGFGALIALAVSRSVLADGDRAVLFADLANPVTVAMYQRLGYRRVAEHAIWSLA